MAKGTADKHERNDIYTAFAVLGLFLLFGFFIYRSSGTSDEVQNVWLEQPESPSGYQGYPYPHDDESLARAPTYEKLTPLPQREVHPVVKAVTPKEADNNPPQASEATPSSPAELEQPVLSAKQPVEARIDLEFQEETLPAIAVETPEVVAEIEEKIPQLSVPVEPVDIPKPKNIPSSTPSPNATNPSSDLKYITHNLPCVWVVGIFKDPSNVNRVLARLRLNEFEVASGFHEKGTYVGVPCACEKDEKKQAQLREVFAAQPWMLKK